MIGHEMHLIRFPCCGKKIPNGHKKKPEELQRIFDKHKQKCKLYKEWLRERANEEGRE